MLPELYLLQQRILYNFLFSSFIVNHIFCTESQLKLNQFWIVNKQKYYLSYCGFNDVRSGCKSRELTQDTDQYLWRNYFIFFSFPCRFVMDLYFIHNSLKYPL